MPSQKLLADSALRQQLGRNARQFAQENFSLDRVRQRYAELYVRLLKKKRREEPRMSGPVQKPTARSAESLPSSRRACAMSADNPSRPICSCGSGRTIPRSTSAFSPSIRRCLAPLPGRNEFPACAPFCASPSTSGISGAASKTWTSLTFSPRPTGRFCWLPRPRDGSRKCAAAKL